MSVTVTCHIVDQTDIIHCLKRHRNHIEQDKLRLEAIEKKSYAKSHISASLSLAFYHPARNLASVWAMQLVFCVWLLVYKYCMAFAYMVCATVAVNFSYAQRLNSATFQNFVLWSSTSCRWIPCKNHNRKTNRWNKCLHTFELLERNWDKTEENTLLKLSGPLDNVIDAVSHTGVTCLLVSSCTKATRSTF